MKPATSAPTALLLIDIQRGFDAAGRWGGTRNNPSFESNISKLLSAFRSAATGNSATGSLYIIHVHHHSVSPGSALHPEFMFRPTELTEPVLGVSPQPYASPLPTEPIFLKSVNSSFIGTQLEAHLREHGVKQLFITGLTTDHCVSTTTRMAANLKVLGEGDAADGEGIYLLRDATATFGKGGFDAETVHKVNLASLDGEFCRVVDTNDVLDTVLGVNGLN